MVESDDPVGALTRRAFELTDVPWDQCHHEDRGKLALVLVPSGLVLEKLPTTMAQAAREAARIHLRVSVHPQAGELTGSTVDRASGCSKIPGSWTWSPRPSTGESWRRPTLSLKRRPLRWFTG